MNVFILIRQRKGVDITGRFDCKHKKLERGDSITDKYGVDYVVNEIVISQNEPDEVIYLHLASEHQPCQPSSENSSKRPAMPRDDDTLL